MSGRTRVTLADGRRVTGYRKTLRRRSPGRPKKPGQMSTLSFALPLMLAWRGTPQLIGVEVSPFGVATVTGVNIDWLKQQAIALVRALEPDWSEPIMAVLTTPQEPGPTISGPMRPKRCATTQLVFTS